MMAGLVRQAVADLLWVVNSPSLIEPADAVGTLRADDVDAERLTAFLAERPGHRVGRYFEHLVLFWLREIRGLEIIASGLQVQDGTRTVGEIDFVFRDTHGKQHWETAVKFFLHCPTGSSSDYPGPNASDNFERKMARLFDKQLRLGESVFPDITRRRAFVRGRMFYHPDVGEPTERPKRLAADHQRGVWIRESELSWLERQEPARGCIANKPQWLAPPVDPQKLVPVRELIAQLTQHFERSRHPVLIMLPGTVDQMFVVPDSWPQI